MADIAAAESWLCCAVLFFGSVDAMRTLGRCVMASKFHPTSQYVDANYFMPKADEPDFAVTGVQSSPRDMFSLLLAFTREGRRPAGSSPVAPRADYKQHYLSPTSNQDRFHVSTVTAEHASPRTAPTPMATTLSARVRAGAFGTRRRCTASG